MSEAPLWFTAKTARHRDRSQIVSIKTGTRELDNKIIGLNKKEVTCISGLRGAAKSTWLSQICLEVADVGKKVALFSGEIDDGRTFEWLFLQAAGKNNTVATSYENFYKVPEDVKTTIKEWLDPRVFVYNNDYGKKIAMILSAVEDCIKRKGVDIVILDNLMSIDLDATTYNKNEKQSNFIQEIVRFARENDVHIIVVAHPRKSIGFLRIDDIAGTADLANAVDNVFIIHRVNNDFKRLAKLTLGVKEDSSLFQYDNVLEICKNRDLGYQDEMIGMYFDVASKRLSCDFGVNRKYGWEK